MDINQDLTSSIHFLIDDIVSKINNEKNHYNKYIDDNSLLIKKIFNFTFFESKLFVEILFEDETKKILVQIIKKNSENYNYLNNILDRSDNIICAYVLTYSIYLEIFLMFKNKNYNVISLSF